MTDSNVEDQPWEGGVSVPVLPPHVPLFDSAAIVVAQPTDAQAGVAVAYSRGIFTRQAWSTGHPVPGDVPPLPPGFLAPLRTGDVRSLTFHLEKALTAGDLDPLWEHLLAFAQQAAA